MHRGSRAYAGTAWQCLCLLEAQSGSVCVCACLRQLRNAGCARLNDPAPLSALPHPAGGEGGSAAEAAAQLRGLAAGEVPPPPAHVIETRAKHAVAVALGAQKEGLTTRATVPSSSGAAVPVSFLHPSSFDALETPKVPSVSAAGLLPVLDELRG